MTNEELLEQQGKAGTVRHVDELMATALNLDGRSNADAVAILIDGDVNQHLRQFNIGGIDVAPKDAGAKVRAELEKRHDETLATDLVAFARDMAKTEKALEQRIADSRRPPVVRDDTRELLLLRKLEGRTLADLATAYGATGDKDDPALVSLIESDMSDLARLFRLRSDDRDTAALMQLQAAIRARQAEREDKTATEHLRVLREWKGRQFRYQHLLNRARSGGSIEVARMRRSHG